MKKLLCWILAVLMLAMLAGCGNEPAEPGNPVPGTSANGEKGQEQQPNEDVDVDPDAPITNENQIDENSKGETFWIHSIDWSKQRDSADLTLFNGMVSLPIKLEDLETCSTQYSFDELQKTLESETKIYSETTISNYTEYIDGKWIISDEVPHIGSITIKNYSDAGSTAAECYSNGWWCICNSYNIDDALGFDATKSDEYNKEMNERPLLDMALEKLGAPTYIRLNKSYSEYLEQNEGGLVYELVFEYNDFTIIIPVLEVIVSEYDAHTIKCSGLEDGMVYYTKECWEKEKNETADDYDIIKK